VICGPEPSRLTREPYCRADRQNRRFARRSGPHSEMSGAGPRAVVAKFWHLFAVRLSVVTNLVRELVGFGASVSRR
jgi:hypothetical protein